MTRLGQKVIDPIARERKHANRRLVFLCLTVLTVVSTVADILSDIFIASRHPVQESGGISTSSQWDLSCSCVIVAWILVAISLWCSKD